MPLSPVPILPGTSPLPEPGKQPPNARALRLGALVVLPVLAAALVVGQVLLPSMLFLLPGLQAQAGATTPGQSGTAFQGFTFPWKRSETGGGYTSPASFQNMQSQAKTFHMNAVIIPVNADMPVANESYLAWHNGDRSDQNTLPQTQYETAIKDARRAGLVPILELVVQQQDVAQNHTDQDGSLIGTRWSELASTDIITTNNGSQTTIANLEKGWFDSYTNFAVHYAQLSEQYHLPYFIIGDGLINVSYDTDATNAKADPRGIDRTVPGDTCPASAVGRRDCEWRHVVNAIRSATYSSLQNHKQSQPGGGYTGKLIYAASWTYATDGHATSPEFESITWWDAVDYIGVDASFPITANEIDPQLSDLLNSWHGKGTNLGLSRSQADIYGRLEKVADKYGRPLIFTSAGYHSVPGANTNGNTYLQEDDTEQLTDMEALLMTFTTASWWAGVFWVGDEPIPRDKQPNWIYSSNWAGTSLSTSKAAGQWLAQYYKPAPLP